MRIGIVKFSLFRTGYLSSAANVLTRSPKIRCVNKRVFLQLIGFTLINDYDKGAAMQISSVLGHVYHVACRMVR